MNSHVSDEKLVPFARVITPGDADRFALNWYDLELAPFCTVSV